MGGRSTQPALAGYPQLLERIRADYAAIPASAPVRLAKKTSNLFRMRHQTQHPGLDVSGFSGVLFVDAQARTADVLGMTTYEDLVDATLLHGLMPLVVPELKTITLGGAVTGLGIESTSFRNGCPHESVLEMDVLTGDGRIITVTPQGEHAELFHGFPNSYGTLGYALRLRIELEPVLPYVMLTHTRFHHAGEFSEAMSTAIETRIHADVAVDFLDGTVFSDAEMYLTAGTAVAEAPYISDYTGNEIYYRSIQARSRDYLAIRDYIWRWDTDWFWCSRALFVQKPWVRRLTPKQYLRSDTYWKVVGFERRHGWKAALDRRLGKPEQEAVIQDVEVPIARLPEFLEFFHREIGIAPVWVCPLRQRDRDRTWDLYVLDPDTIYANVGFWSTVSLPAGAADGHHNRRIEQVVGELGGRKSLYSTSFYPREEFWATYGGATYDVLKKSYDPDQRLLNLYEKTVQGR